LEEIVFISPSWGEDAEIPKAPEVPAFPKPGDDDARDLTDDALVAPIEAVDFVNEIVELEEAKLAVGLAPPSPGPPSSDSK
jgi:hypothetical protein